MIKFGSLIATALLSAGIATASIAADLPKSAATAAADAPAAPAKAKHAASGKKGSKGKSKKSTPAPSTSH